MTEGKSPVVYEPSTDTMALEIRPWPGGEGEAYGGADAGPDLVIHYAPDGAPWLWEIEHASQHPEHIVAGLAALRVAADPRIHRHRIRWGRTVAGLKNKIKRTKGTDIVSIFWGDDEGLLKYRHQHLRTGLMVSVGKWLHIYELQDEQGFQKKPHYTHTKTKPKVCVASYADIPALISFVLDNLATPLDRVKWGASGARAADKLEDELFRAHGFSLTADGHMVRSGVPPAASVWLRMDI